MHHQDRLDIVHWNGDTVDGGEPAWFQDAACAGIITRSADGVGPCLYVKTPSAYTTVIPGDILYRTTDGVITLLKDVQQAA